MLSVSDLPITSDNFNQAEFKVKLEQRLIRVSPSRLSISLRRQVFCTCATQQRELPCIVPRLGLTQNLAVYSKVYESGSMAWFKYSS